jgi:ArsR family transcriptional regulator
MDPVKFFKCLADGTRLRCLLLLEHENELCVCELTAALNEAQPKVSRHLAQLRECDLLLDRRQGQWVYYRINQALPTWAKTTFTHALAENAPFLAENLRRLQGMGDRPTRAKACC